MKNLLLIFTLLFSSVFFSSSSYAGWEKVSADAGGNTHYVDYERIRKVDGFVYYWYLSDLLKPDKDGDLSSKTYIQGDCKLFRHKGLSGSFHKEPMGGGTGDVQEPVKKGWKYPSPNSVSETILKSVCSR